MLVNYQKQLACFATFLTLIVVILGAYTRLSDAGLGCPDWPGCYGKLIVPKVSALPDHHIIDAADTTKAWIEMTHRYVAGLLGLVILSLALLALYNRHARNQPIILPIVLVMLVIFQALLGMWTVTLKLYPIIVLAHLLGGLATLSGLWWLTLKLQTFKTLNQQHLHSTTRLQYLAMTGLYFLVLQIALGGWTSANYAALVCPDFPFCQGTALNAFPSLQLTKAFQVFNPSLSLEARMTIHILHRIGAVMTTLILGWLVVLMYKHHLKKLSLSILILLIVQLLLGITNVIALLPLPVAVAHNAIAALLLLTLVTVNFQLQSRP